MLFLRIAPSFALLISVNYPYSYTFADVLNKTKYKPSIQLNN